MTRPIAGSRTATVLALLLLLAVMACDTASSSRRAEAGVLIRAVERLRAAPNEEKAAALPLLAQAPCSSPDLCALRELCLTAYQRHTAALTARRELAAAVAASTPPADAAARLAALEAELDVAHPLVLDCSRRQLALSARYRP